MCTGELLSSADQNTAKVGQSPATADSDGLTLPFAARQECVWRTISFNPQHLSIIAWAFALLARFNKPLGTMGYGSAVTGVCLSSPMDVVNGD